MDELQCRNLHRSPNNNENEQLFKIFIGNFIKVR